MIIALIGNKRSGKDTFYNVVKETPKFEKYNFQRYAFADPIKEAVKIIFGWDTNYMEEHKENIDSFYGISPRQVLQHLGTDWAQFNLCEYPQYKHHTGRSLWVKRFHQWYDSFNTPPNVIITDVRFQHEYEYIKDTMQVESYFVRIHRQTGNQDTHASETELTSIPYNYYMSNNSTYEDYCKRIIQVMETMI